MDCERFFPHDADDGDAQARQSELEGCAQPHPKEHVDTVVFDHCGELILESHVHCQDHHGHNRNDPQINIQPPIGRRHLPLSHDTKVYSDPLLADAESSGRSLPIRETTMAQEQMDGSSGERQVTLVPAVT